MISELAGYTLVRAIPDNVLLGVLTGTYKIFGGVIRDHGGRIIAHLANASTPLAIGAMVGTGPVGMVGSAAAVAFDGINAFQLYRLGKGLGELKDSVAAVQAATAKIIGLSQATMALSGLTLVVCAAGFAFLSWKLEQVDKKLAEISKDVKAIRTFLESQETAALTSALKTLAGVSPDLEDKTRIPLLIDARQTLGEIHQRYRDQLLNVDDIALVTPIEEYFSVTGLGQAMCSAELDMQNNAVSDLDEAIATWQTATRKICTDLVMRDDPERMLTAVYAPVVRADEIVDWLDFANSTDKEIEWIDELRKNASFLRLPHIRLSDEDKQGIEVMRKIVARNRIFKGYAAQYRYLASIKARPSDLQQFLGTLDPSKKVDDCFVFVANEELAATR